MTAVAAEPPYAARERVLLAPWAMHAIDSAGRASPEPEHPYRSPYQRDRDRITHTAAFRRLSHKTQVFTRELGDPAVGDYHRSRLTHTLEVASVARTLARALRLNEDLVETLALAHDVGHPPFGHAGEAVLDERLRAVGGFNHNAQAVRVFTRLENRYPDRPGLNLSAEVLDAQQRRGAKPARTEDRPSPEPEWSSSDRRPLLEEQVVDAADSIAYDSHDVDDALEAGLLSLADLDEAPLWRESAARVRSRYAALSETELRQATVHELIDRQVGDILRVTTSAIERRAIDSVAAVRSASPLVGPSQEIAEQKLQLEAFLFRRVYRHESVLAHRAEATAALEEWLDACLANPTLLPERLTTIVQAESLRRAAGDYLASLTDRAALAGPSEPGAPGR